MVISHVFCNNVAIFMGDFLQLGQLYLSLGMFESICVEFFFEIMEFLFFQFRSQPTFGFAIIIVDYYEQKPKLCKWNGTKNDTLSDKSL